MVEGEDVSEAVIIDTQSFRAGGGDDGRASGTAAASFIVALICPDGKLQTTTLGTYSLGFGLKGEDRGMERRGEVTNVRRNQYSESRDQYSSSFAERP